MAIGVYFAPPDGLTKDLYDQSMQKLDQAGASAPKGRTYHAAFGDPGHLMVFEIWDSQADFEAFGAVLMPILASIPINPGTPDIMDVVNEIKA